MLYTLLPLVHQGLLQLPLNQVGVSENRAPEILHPMALKKIISRSTHTHTNTPKLSDCSLNSIVVSHCLPIFYPMKFLVFLSNASFESFLGNCNMDMLSSMFLYVSVGYPPCWALIRTDRFQELLWQITRRTKNCKAGEIVQRPQVLVPWTSGNLIPLLDGSSHSLSNANIGLITPPQQGQQGQQGLWDPASY